MADILDLLINGDPMAKQKRQADALRGQQQFQDMVQGASQQGNSLNLLNFVSQNANNPVLAKSVAAIAGQQQDQYAPQKLDKGVYVPGTGQYQESPGVAEEKENDREMKRLQAASVMQARQEATDARNQAANAAVEQRREAAADRNSILSLTRGAMTAAQAQAAADRKARTDAKAEDDADKRVTKFSGTLEKAGVPEFEQALQIAEGRLTKYKPGELPGFGRIEGSIPNALATNEMQMSRSDMQQAANILLKSRSGAAVTDTEMKRFLTEVASGAGMSEEALRSGWKNVRSSFEAKKTGIMAGVGDDVLDTYNSRSPTIQLNRRSTDKAVQIKSDADYAALPSGAEFIAPDGSHRKKP